MAETAGTDADYTGDPSSAFSLDGLFKSVSPYLNSFASGASSGFVGYVLGNKRDTPGLMYTGTGSAATSHPSSLSTLFPWIAAGVVLVLAVMFLGRR